MRLYALLAALLLVGCSAPPEPEELPDLRDINPPINAPESPEE
jgi:uncharacterized protein YcfL